MTLAELAQCCRLVRLRVKGFKSLYDVLVEFPTSLTVLVGPNGSGKTAVIESLLLLRDVLDYLRGRVANPFLRWWGYRNVVWMHDESLPIELAVTVVCSECDREELKSLLSYLDVDVEIPNVTWLEGRTIDYSVTVSGAGGTFSVLREQLCVQSFGCIEVAGGKTNLQLEEGVLRALMKILEENVRKLVGGIGEGEGLVNEVVEGLRSALMEILAGPMSLGRLGSLAKFYVEAAGQRYAAGAVLKEALDLALNLLESQISRSTRLKQNMVKMVERLSRVGEDHLLKQLAKLGVSVEMGRGKELAENMSKTFMRMFLTTPLTFIFVVFLVATVLVCSFIDNIVVLRLLDYRSLRSPQPLESVERLREDGSNLVSLLFRLGRGRLPSDIAEVLASVLGAESVSGYFEPTPDGRVMLKLVVDGVELAPPSIPEGAWKTMAVMAAILSGASLVAVDEFENSLHATAQELLLEELRRGVPTAIVATHSPVVVDAAKSLEEIALVEIESGKTRVRRLREPEKLAEKLRELGITPSEALLYGVIETS